MTNIVVNGNAYSDDGSSARDMQGGGWRLWLLRMIDDQMVEVRWTGDQAVSAINASNAATNAANATTAAANATIAASNNAVTVAQDARDAAIVARNESASARNDAVSAKNAAEAAADRAVEVGPGWSPEFALIFDADRVVQQVVDWAGGEGNKPAIGMYVGDDGFVADIADAVNIRGATGFITGDGVINERPVPDAGVVTVAAGGADGEYAMLNGYGLYRWDEASTLPADRETVIAPTAGSGRWLLRLPALELVNAWMIPALAAARRDKNTRLAEALGIAFSDRITANEQSIAALRQYALPLIASADLNFPSVAAYGSQSLSVAVTGASVGDFVQVARPTGLAAALQISAQVSAANTVSITLFNASTAAIDPASASFKVGVYKGTTL